MKSFFKNVLHAIRMHMSKTYARNFQVNTALANLQQLVDGCEHHTADIEAMKRAAETVDLVDPIRFPEAVAILAAADNFQCMELAIGYDRRQGKPCADRLMDVARWHLRLCGHGDRATWARKRLLIAREWYALSDTMTAAIRAEIEQGLRDTEWVLSL